MPTSTVHPARCARRDGVQIHEGVRSSTTSSSASRAGTLLNPMPPVGKSGTVRSLEVREPDELDEKQLATWITQAASIPGWDGGSPRNGGSPV